MIVLLATPAFAFLSPSTLTLIANSLGAFLWGLVILASVNAVLIIRKMKEKPKRAVQIISVIILVVLFVVFMQRYYVLKGLNDAYDYVPLDEYEIDLNTLPEEEYLQYKRFQIDGFITANAWVTGAERIVFTGSEDFIELFDDDPDKFAEYYNVTKDDDLLFMCESGRSSRYAANKFRKAGYKTNFARLSRVKTDSLFSAKYKKGGKISSKLVLVPYKNQDNLLYVDLGLKFNRYYLEEMEEYDVRMVNHTRVTRDMLLDNNVVCGINLHCVLTKYFFE